MRKILQNPLYAFLLKAGGLYVLWLFVYELWLHPMQVVDLAVIDNIVFFAGGILKIFGFEITGENPFFQGLRTLGVEGSQGVWIGDPCNGLTLFALFTGFILAYPGPIRRKLWFIPIGLVAVHFINILRVVALVLIERYYPESLDFNHTYTFTIIVYSLVFYLWYLWANKLSKT